MNDAIPTEPLSPRDAAIKRLNNRRSFWQNLVCYVVFNAFVVGIWYATSPGEYFWPAWLMGAWGFGLVMHLWTAFVQKPITEDDVRREIERGGPVAA